MARAGSAFRLNFSAAAFDGRRRSAIVARRVMADGAIYRRHVRGIADQEVRGEGSRARRAECRAERCRPAIPSAERPREASRRDLPRSISGLASESDPTTAVSYRPSLPGTAADSTVDERWTDGGRRADGGRVGVRRWTNGGWEVGGGELVCRW